MTSTNAKGSLSSQPLLISFSGIDGAGKSTQLELLRSHLLGAGLRLQLLRFWDDAATLRYLRESAGHRIFKGEKGVGTPEAPVNRQDKNVRSPLMTMVRLATYLLDALSLRAKVAAAAKTGVDVIIFDRYIYDEFANLDLRSWLIDKYVRGLLRIVPAPHVSFVIDAEPQAARARKPEYPLDFLIENRNAYLQISKFGEHFCVTRTGSVDEVQAKVWKRVLQIVNSVEAPRRSQRFKDLTKNNSQTPEEDPCSLSSDC
jgi:thymidylate kinase